MIPRSLPIVVSKIFVFRKKAIFIWIFIIILTILYHGEQCNAMVIFLQGANFTPQRGLKSENLRAALASDCGIESSKNKCINGM